MNELFRMNAHGDIWQEPTLFDQGAELPPVVACVGQHAGTTCHPCELAIDRAIADDLEQLGFTI